MGKYSLQILGGDAVVLTFMLFPMFGRVTLTGSRNSLGSFNWNQVVQSSKMLGCLSSRM